MEEYALFNYIFFPSEVEIGFYDKIKMFEKLVEDALPRFKKKYPQTIKKLNQIRRIRNVFAHGDATDPFVKNIKQIKKEIIFTVVEKGQNKEITYTFDYVKEIVRDCHDLNGVLAEQIRELKRSNNIFIGYLKKLK